MWSSQRLLFVSLLIIMKHASLQAALGFQSNLTDLFGPHLSPKAQIIPPTTPEYPAQLQQRWTDYNAPSYSLGAIKPATEQDVQNIVKIAAANHVPFFTTGGGHGVSDYRSFDGLSIDLSAFNSLVFSEDGSQITIGGSVKIHQLVKPLYEAGKELPLGSCACVGVVGATLSGGIGGLQGHRGLLMDSLESVRVATAAGNLLIASPSENEDLFWALRGAGSNFGIVTSATYRLPEISNGGMYMNADFLFSATVNSSFWQALKSFDHGMPSRLAITAAVLYNRLAGEVSLIPTCTLMSIDAKYSLGPAYVCRQRHLLRPTGRRRAICSALETPWAHQVQHQHGPC